MNLSSSAKDTTRQETFVAFCDLAVRLGNDPAMADQMAEGLILRLDGVREKIEENNFP